MQLNHVQCRTSTRLSPNTYSTYRKSLFPFPCLSIPPDNQSTIHSLPRHKHGLVLLSSNVQALFAFFLTCFLACLSATGVHEQLKKLCASPVRTSTDWSRQCNVDAMILLRLWSHLSSWLACMYVGSELDANQPAPCFVCYSSASMVIQNSFEYITKEGHRGNPTQSVQCYCA